MTTYLHRDAYNESRLPEYLSLSYEREADRLLMSGAFNSLATLHDTLRASVDYADFDPIPTDERTIFILWQSLGFPISEEAGDNSITVTDAVRSTLQEYADAYFHLWEFLQDTYFTL